MSSEWPLVRIEDIAANQPSAMATGPFGSSISSKFFQESGIPVIRGSNLSADVQIKIDDLGLVFVSEDKAKEFPRCIVSNGDLVFTCWGTINQVGLIDDTATYQKYLISNKQMKLTVDRTKADSRFVYYVFSGPTKQSEIIENGIGSSVPGFNLGQLRKHSFRLPPLAEQQAIADVLDIFSNRISLLRETNATLEAIAQALFKSWFVDFEPVHARARGEQPAGLPPEVAALFPDSFEESDLGMVPKGWSLSPLSEAYEINPTRKLKKGEMAPYLDMASVATSGHTVAGVADREMGSGTKFINGDTLLARITPCLENGKTAFVDFLAQEQTGWGSTEFVVLRPKAPLPTYHGYLLARHPAFREHAIQSMSGTSGRQRVQNDVLGRYLVTVPSEKVTMAFNDVISPLQQKITENHRQAQTLANLRDTLLPLLISGQLRLPDAEAMVSEAQA